jgi:hypothetical protein
MRLKACHRTALTCSSNPATIRDPPSIRRSGTSTSGGWRSRRTARDFVRLTHFADFDGRKAANPVVSPDGRSFAFQGGRSSDPPGVGYGIFVYRLPSTDSRRR